MKLEGKVTIVTGGGAGIRKGIVCCLAEEGADVAVIDINAETANDVSNMIMNMGRKSRAIITNVTDSKQAEQALGMVLGFFDDSTWFILSILQVFKEILGKKEKKCKRTNMK